MADRLRVKITADDSGFKPVVANANRQLSKLGSAGGVAGKDIGAGMSRGATQIKSIGDELSAVSGNIASGNAVAIASVGSLSHVVLEYGQGLTSAVKNTRELKIAAEAAAAASLAHHQQLTRQFSSLVAAGQGSTEYAQSLRRQISASTGAVQANRAHAASLSPVKAGLSALGGPVGLITTAATALGLWYLTSKDATEQTKKETAANNALADSFDKASTSVIASNIIRYQDALAKIGNKNSGAATFLQSQIDQWEAKIAQVQIAEQRIRDVLQKIQQKNQPKSVTEKGGASSKIESGSKAEQYAGDAVIAEFRAREDAVSALESSLLNEEQRIGESYAKRAAIVDNNVSDTARANVLKLQLQEEYFAKLEGLELKREEKVKTRADYERQVADQWADSWTSAGNRFAAGIGDAFADVALEQQSFAEAAASLMQAVIRQVISSLVELAVKQAAIHLLGLGQQATATAATVASNVAIAKSAAPAAAGVSLATAGVNSIPAAAGISSTYALTSGLAVSGIAHDGLEYVPKTGTYILERGERVVKQADNRELSRALSRPGGGGVNVIQNFKFDTIDGQSAVAFVKDNLGLFESVSVSGVQKAYNRRGARGPLG